MDRAKIEQTVRRYVELIDSGTAEQVLELYAEGATVEDPVGVEPLTEREQILAFYRAMEPIERQTELNHLKVAGNTAVFGFTVTAKADVGSFKVSPVDIMLFDEDAKIVSMRAVWDPSEVEMLPEG